MSKVADELDRIEDEIRELRIAYEKYFAGIERIEPIKERQTLKTAVRRLVGEQSRNTARRFRIQSLQASLVTYESYWTRICRQIEDGTYRRERWRAARMQVMAQEPEISAHGAELDAPAPLSAPSGTPADAAVRYPPSLQKLYDALVTARAKVGDDRPVSIDALAVTVRKQIAELKTRFQCESVEFKVGVKDGKVVLKASPKGGAQEPATAPRAANPAAASGASET